MYSISCGTIRGTINPASLLVQSNFPTKDIRFLKWPPNKKWSFSMLAQLFTKSMVTVHKKAVIIDETVFSFLTK